MPCAYRVQNAAFLLWLLWLVSISQNVLGRRAPGNETQYREGTMMKQRINRLKLGRRISKEFEVCCHHLRPSLKRDKFCTKFYCSNINDLSGYASPVTSGTLTVIWWNWQLFWRHTNMFCSCAFQVFRDSLLLQNGLKMQPKSEILGVYFYDWFAHKAWRRFQ